MLNARTTKQILQERLQEGSALLKDAGTLLSFGLTVAAIAANPSLVGAAFVAAFLSASGAAVSAGSRLQKQLNAGTEPALKELKESSERFQAMFYTECQIAYLSALEDSQELKNLANAENLPSTQQASLRLEQTLKEHAEKLQDADVSFYYSVDPSIGNIPLFEAYSAWLDVALAPLISDSTKRMKITQKISKDARHRLQRAFSANTAEAAWMRDYLALGIHEATASQVDNLRSQLDGLDATLRGWTFPLLDAIDRRGVRWTEYRVRLKELPFQRESMYAEMFGVAEVFVSPAVSYQRIGTRGEPHTKVNIESVAVLLGALVSARVSGDDLVFICGGPGSGKSTLCRMLAAKLATEPTVHPVFLKLRRCKEGAEFSAFIEENLIREGVVNRLSDLKDLPNVVIILDGFDEIAMASKGRLRHLFQALADDLRTGPLRNARVVVSGRDTLFRDGEGLPRESHVLTVLPFEELRVAEWAANWRRLHPTGHGNNFSPELLLRKATGNALEQLARWPLTLHLLARLHTSGMFDVTSAGAAGVEKAYLYRGILHETAMRQSEQASGEGRLEPRQMRRFLRAVALEMYQRSVDSLMIEDVVSLAKEFFKGRDDVAMRDLAEVAIVNSPEIKTGEDTGFEFVHKSFAEFLIGELLAEDVERASHRVVGIDGEEIWQYELRDARNMWHKSFSVRVIPSEVQEMMGPILGVFAEFQKGSLVNDQVPLDAQLSGLRRVRRRCEELYAAFARSEQDVDVGIRGDRPVRVRDLASHGVNISIIGALAAQRISERLTNGTIASEGFNMEPFPGALWSWLLLVHAGGVRIEADIADRVFSASRAKGCHISDRDFPVRLHSLGKLEGYESVFDESLPALQNAIRRVIERTLVLAAALERRETASTRRSREGVDVGHFADHALVDVGHFADHALDVAMAAIETFEKSLAAIGLLDPGLLGTASLRRRGYSFREHSESLNALPQAELAELVSRITGSYCGKASGDLDLKDILHGTGRGPRFLSRGPRDESGIEPDANKKALSRIQTLWASGKRAKAIESARRLEQELIDINAIESLRRVRRWLASHHDG